MKGQKVEPLGVDLVKPGSRWLKPYWYLVAFGLLALLLTIIRRPDAITNAQFWAEDGRVWFMVAHNYGPVQGFFNPENGYFQTISRVAAALATVVPLVYAPLVFNLLAIIVQAAPAVLLVSRRFESIIPKRWVRSILGLVYLALPNTSEIQANITNAHWHLAILSLMVLVAEEPASQWGRLFDYGLLAIAGLSGPFSLFLAPLAALWYWFGKRGRHQLINTLIIGAAAFVQFISLLTHGSVGRSHAPLGATWKLLVRIWGGEIGGGLFFGHQPQAVILHSRWVPYMGLIVLGIVALALLKGRLELKLLNSLAILALGAALVFPMASLSQPQWMALTESGNRYWFIPMIALLVDGFWLAGKKQFGLKLIGLAMIVVVVTVGIPKDFILKPYPDLHWYEQAKQFEQLTPGSVREIPINPDTWTTRLIKR